MIDPKEILSAAMSAQQFGQSAQQSLLGPFMQSIPTMNPDASTNASNIIGSVQQMGQQMLAQMTSIKASVDQQLFIHQDKQLRQKTYDFTRNMNDLRPTDAKGFPEEMGDPFFARFRTK